jgi:hypothetical protein
MKNLYEEGGIADDGMEVDPVSGNEIPPGSMAEEVRDDVDAKLSSGEYVVPADVVRFFGVAFFEGLRSKAKEGLAEMESNGRIGGEPVIEMEEEEFPEMGMAKGGDVGIDKNARKILESLKRSPQLRERLKASGVTIKMAEGGDVGTQTQSAFAPPSFSNIPGFSTFTPVPTTPTTQNIEYRTYENVGGQKMTIMFVDGVATQEIPQGYFPEGQVPPEEDKPKPEKKDKDPNLTAPAAPRTPAVNLYGMGEDDLSAWAQGGIGGSFLSGAGGLIGTAADLDAISRTRAAARVARDQGYEALQLQLETAASDMQEDLGWIGSLLEGTIATGDQYYEDQQQFRTSTSTSRAPTPKGQTPTNQSTRNLTPSSSSGGNRQSRTPTGTNRGNTFTVNPSVGTAPAPLPSEKTTQQSGRLGTTTSPTTKPKPTTPMTPKQFRRGGLIQRPNK